MIIAMPSIILFCYCNLREQNNDQNPNSQFAIAPSIGKINQTNNKSSPSRAKYREKHPHINNLNEKLSRKQASHNMSGVLFEDIFDVKDIDPDGKKFERGESISLLISVGYSP